MPKQQFPAEIPGSQRSPYVLGIVAKWLLRTPLIGAIDSLEDIDDTFLAIGVGSRNQINGRIFQMDTELVSSIDCFDVSRQLQRRGVGERLLKAYVAKVKAEGAQSLWSDAVSSQALGLRAKVLGAEAMHFYDAEHSEHGFLPMDVGQAVLTNTRINELDLAQPYRPDPQSHIGVYVNLERLDTTGWELPELLQIREPAGL